MGDGYKDCYKSTRDFLTNFKPVAALTENAALDVASFRRNLDQTIKVLDGLNAVGGFEGEYKYAEVHNSIT